MFNQNDVISRGGRLFRILFINREQAGLYELGDAGASAKISYSTVSLETLNTEAAQGTVSAADDPYGEFKYSSPDEKRLKRAQESYKLISPIVSDPDVLYTPARCSDRLRELAGGDQSIRRQLYRLLARWLQRGQCLYALLPDFRGVGRNKHFTNSPGRKNSSGAKIPVYDEELKKLMDGILRKYVLKEDGISLQRAYAELIKVYQKLHPGSDLQPSISQLKSYYYRTYNRRHRNQKRNSSITYNKDLKARMGSVYDAVSAAGEIFEIDSTPDNVYLVSSIDRSLCIGRPVLYSVTDRFTGLVVGIYVSLENAQYKSAAEALFSAVSEKGRYFKENFGIDFQWDWNAKGIPAAICADNAELEGSRIEVFARSHNVALINAAPYRADQKGTVESSIYLIQKELHQFLAVAAPDTVILKKAGGEDRRTKGFLDLREYRTLVLRAVEIINNRLRKKVPSDYPPDRIRSPKELWNWAVNTGRSDLQTPHDLMKLRVSLLAQEKATISREGIKCRGLKYTCPELETAGWFDRDKGGRKTCNPVMAIDNGDVGCAWVYPNPARHPDLFYSCRLKSEHQKLRGCCLYEAEKELESISRTQRLTVEQQDRIRADLTGQIKDILDDAKGKTAAVQSTLSDKEKIARIRSSRQNEQNLDSRSRTLANPQSSAGINPAAEKEDQSAQWGLFDTFTDLFVKK